MMNNTLHDWAIDANNIQPGDIVEFLSDLQTEKGPSSGACAANHGDVIIIDHSDVYGDRFKTGDLRIKYFKKHGDGKRYWGFE